MIGDGIGQSAVLLTITGFFTLVMLAVVYEAIRERYGRD